MLPEQRPRCPADRSRSLQRIETAVTLRFASWKAAPCQPRNTRAHGAKPIIHRATDSPTYFTDRGRSESIQNLLRLGLIPRYLPTKLLLKKI